MSDTMTQEQRHRCMSHIRGRDTKPELLVRRYLWRKGYRYRLYDRRLPGRPDIIMRQRRTVIFVNGCFWHGHDCDKFRMPKSNTEFWQQKIERNRRRDRSNRLALKAMGFNVITVWECELTPKKRLMTLRSLDRTLSRLLLKQMGDETYADTPSTTQVAAEPETAEYK